MDVGPKEGGKGIRSRKIAMQAKRKTIVLRANESHDKFDIPNFFFSFEVHITSPLVSVRLRMVTE